jgi:hypothetical protein
LDLLEKVEAEWPSLRALPRIYRCQNTALAHRLTAPETCTRESLGSLSPWFLRASDPRFSLVLVQTLDDVELIGRALPGVHVAPCPYGYDPLVFDPALPDLERTIDVGCYFNLKDSPHRRALVKAAEDICGRRGWSFRFVSGTYWHEYAGLIRSTKVCLHYSLQQEVPYRMYEVTCLGALFLTDPLRYSVGQLFTLGSEYLTFHPDLRDLESVLASVLQAPEQWNAIRRNGRNRALHYSWPQVAERYVAGPLREVVSTPHPVGAIP